MCAICKKPGGAGFRALLRWLGIKGDHAHPNCVALAQRQSTRSRKVINR